MIEKFRKYLEEQGKSKNTINSYVQHIQMYSKWYNESFDKQLDKLYRANILDYKSYLDNIEKNNAKTINAKLSALIKFNEFLIDSCIQEDIVVSKKDNKKIQNQFASPTNFTKKDIEAFRQTILEQGSKRDYAIVTLMAYAGLRISETLDLKLSDFNITSREIVIKSGKGEKQRTVFMNDKIVNALNEYLKERESNSEWLFISRQSERVNRTRINQIFKQFSKSITPHSLRHFWCTNALENGFSIHEVASLAGHSNIHTTLLYTNPTREKMKEKANLL